MSIRKHRIKDKKKYRKKFMNVIISSDNIIFISQDFTNNKSFIE